jgi:hypothetical protein
LVIKFGGLLKPSRSEEDKISCFSRKSAQAVDLISGRTFTYVEQILSIPDFFIQEVSASNLDSKTGRSAWGFFFCDFSPFLQEYVKTVPQIRLLHKLLVFPIHCRLFISPLDDTQFELLPASLINKWMHNTYIHTCIHAYTHINTYIHSTEIPS